MRNWPLFQLSITTPRIELRYPSLEDLDELADRAAEGVHDAERMPFTFPWTDAEPDVRARSTLQYQFRSWGNWTQESWACDFVVVLDGQVIGTQGLNADAFAIRREVTTGSWLGQRFQGQGIGTEMRAAVLHLAFEGLQAEYAVTSAFDDNPASQSVTGKLGYREDGIDVHNRRGKAATLRRFRLARADRTPRQDIEIKGLEPCLPLFGAQP